MLRQQTVYFIGVLNLVLAGVAIFCVVQAEENPEYFSLIYIAIIIFIFYMGTILVIIILQIAETYKDERPTRQTFFEVQMPELPVELSSLPLDPSIDETITTTANDNLRKCRSQTLSLGPTSEKSFHASSLIIKNYKTKTSDIIITSTCQPLLSDDEQKVATTQKNYQSFACMTSDTVFDGK